MTESFIITKLQMEIALRDAWTHGYSFASSSLQGKAAYFVQTLACETLDKLQQVKQPGDGK